MSTTSARTDPGRPGAATPPSRTLAEELRRWPEERLAALLLARPDLATPAPQDSTQLASRAATRASLLRALDGLSRPELIVLDALAVAGPMDRDHLREVVHAEPPSVDAAVDRLLDLALAWEAPDGLRALGTVADAIGSSGSGLRPRSARPASPEEVRARIASVSDGARAALEHLDAHGGEGRSGRARRSVTPASAANPVEELLAHRLLVPGEGELVRMPGEVGIALRDGRTTRERVDEVPEVATTDREQSVLDRAAAGAAFEAVRRVELLLDHWGTHPPAVLRSGGLGVRDLRATATMLHVDEATAGLLVELVAAAGLLAQGQDAEGDPAWVPTDAYDAVSAEPVAQRWALLARSWLETSRVPSRVGERDASGKAANALAPDLVSPAVRDVRELVLTTLGSLPAGAGLASGTGTPSLVARLHHERPRWGRATSALAPAAVTEAATLGLLGLGGATTHGRHAVAGRWEEAAAALAPLLPEPVDHVLLQADLTAVAPGPLESRLARRLQLLADVESRGGATVYRFTPGSLRRALDVGWTGSELHAFLSEVSRTPVPQPLEYLVDDAVRTFGTVRVGAVESFLRADDEAALTEVLHHQVATALGLRRIAPTVLVSPTPLDVLLPRLREMGASPVVEAPDGTVRVARPDLLRARTPRRRGRDAARDAHATARVSSVVSAVRAGDRAAAQRPARTTATTPADALAVLREAAQAGDPVWIGYVDNHGTTTERVVEPIRVEAGQLTAHDQRTGEERSFAVHRITAVRTIPDG